jgi:hypothetical protein
VHRFEATLHAARSENLPNRHRLRQALHHNRTEIAVVEMPPGESARARADQHCPRIRQRLQARGEVWRLPDDGLLRCGPINQELADNDSARRDADANLQRDISADPEIRDGVNESEPGAYALFRIILLRSRIAKISEHAVAHVARDHALVAADNLGDAGVIRRDHPPHVFRIQPRREGGRADQIAKHHR